MLPAAAAWTSSRTFFDLFAAAAVELRCAFLVWSHIAAFAAWPSQVTTKAITDKSSRTEVVVILITRLSVKSLVSQLGFSPFLWLPLPSVRASFNLFLTL